MKELARMKISVGDVFCAAIDEASVKVFQYVAVDLTQLNSDVIRVFRESYASCCDLNVEKIINGSVDFYAHVFIRIGLRQKCWCKIGHSNNVGNLNVLFRDSNDYGNPEIKVSNNWHFWEINKPFHRIGNMTVNYQRAEVGVVVPPRSLVHRMRTGEYNFAYPTIGTQ